MAYATINNEQGQEARGQDEADGASARGLA